MKRPRHTWRLRTRTLELGARTRVMGVVNVTPDSFSDGGRYFSTDVAISHALEMLDEGADILDIGGESTRPGQKEPVTQAMELDRVLPVLRGILRLRPESVISVDTYKAGVARVALDEGAEIINDVSGFQWDSNMPEVVAETGCGVVLMHMRGRPETWRSLPPLPDPTDTVKKELAYYVGVALKFGVRREQIALDPGFGFGKNFDENYPLLARLAELHELGFPLLSGTSRKSFVGHTLGDAPPEQRLYGTLATVTASVQAGAHIVRVHDVPAAVEAVKVADALLRASKDGE
ncbi:MAG: dihydropteroate synthase [Acidobacteriales bacterium]|nr:dihydropteroate synthase [Terriglobales bacterium]